MGHLSQEQKLWASTRHSTWRSAFLSKGLATAATTGQKSLYADPAMHQDSRSTGNGSHPMGSSHSEGMDLARHLLHFPFTYMKEEVFLEPQSQPQKVIGLRRLKDCRAHS